METINPVVMINQAKAKMDSDRILACLVAELYNMADLAIQSSNEAVNAFAICVCMRIGELLYGVAKPLNPSDEDCAHYAKEALAAFSLTESPRSIM